MAAALAASRAEQKAFRARKARGAAIGRMASIKPPGRYPTRTDARKLPTSDFSFSDCDDNPFDASSNLAAV